jgi:Uncharacterized Fe-S protein
MPVSTDIDYAALASDIKRWAVELGFADAGIAGTELGHDEAYLERWLADGHHGEMDYMARTAPAVAAPPSWNPAPCG